MVLKRYSGAKLNQFMDKIKLLTIDDLNSHVDKPNYEFFLGSEDGPHREYTPDKEIKTDSIFDNKLQEHPQEHDHIIFSQILEQDPEIKPKAEVPGKQTQINQARNIQHGRIKKEQDQEEQERQKKVKLDKYKLQHRETGKEEKKT